MPHRFRSLLSGLLASVVAVSAHAADAQTPAEARLRLNGFATLGAAASDMPDPWVFRREVSQGTRPGDPDPLAVDSRIGLQAHWQIDPRWEAVGQAVFKKQADTAPAAQRIEWAFVAYRPTPEITARVGRTSLDLFLLADYRNVGFAYPWVRPSVEFYGRIPSFALDGVDLVRTWRDGQTVWKAKLFGGRTRTVIPGPTGDLRPKSDGLFGGTLSREADGLLLKASYAHIRLSFQGPPELNGLVQGLETLASLGLGPISDEARALRQGVPAGEVSTRYGAIGAAYDQGPWLLHAELSKTSSDVRGANGWHAYVSAGYRLGAVTVYGMGARAIAKSAVASPTHWGVALTPILGAEAAAQAQALGEGAAFAANDARSDQRSVSLGLRWDVNPSTALKLQWDRIHVGAQGGGLWGHSTPQAQRANVLSITVDTVF